MHHMALGKLFGEDVGLFEPIYANACVPTADFNYRRLGYLFTTLYGPSYGSWSCFLNASRHRKTRNVATKSMNTKCHG